MAFVHQTRTAAALAAAVLALTAGCGGSGSDTTGNSSTPSRTGSGALLHVEDVSLGKILTDRQGKTVYVFAKDTDGTSNCAGTCATDWPPVVAPQSVPSAAPGVSGPLGSTARQDGSTQLTVAGHPVYTFSGDTEPGETNGQGLTLDGGLWTAVTPAGSPVSGSGESTPPGDDPGYGY